MFSRGNRLFGIEEGNSSVIHINQNSAPSGIDRAAFDSFRRDCWMNRAGDFIK
jgi:hypothetical protein